MNEPELFFIDCDHKGSQAGTHRMAYWSHGLAHHPHVVVCVHGLTRQGRDFDVLAAKLLGTQRQRCRVVSVDIAGRGMSSWLPDPALYQLPQYAADITTLLFALKGQGAQTIDWVGTSMGGLIGIAIAAQTALMPQLQSVTLRKLILNDVGPAVQWEALQRICAYLGADKRYVTEQEAVDDLWTVSKSFGPHTSAQWLALCRPMIRPDGLQFRLHYDPTIATAVRATTSEASAHAQLVLWQLYDAIQSETLLIRGLESDLISVQTAEQMQTRGPRAKLVQFAGVGHAPTLVQPDQTRVVEQFLFG